MLTHLLSPSKPSSPEPLLTKPPFSRRATSNDFSDSVSALKHEDTRESSPRPKKRSRPAKEDEADPEVESVESAESESSGESWVWTNELPADEPSLASLSTSSMDLRHLRENVDPIEILVRGEEARQLPGARYAQRTDVFEALLKFVDEIEKQPKESLLDLVGSG